MRGLLLFRIALAGCLACLALPATSQTTQTGRVIEQVTLHSEILDMDRHYAVYLPPDYDHSERSYPVLYLLHGGGDDQTGWIQFGEVMHIADKAILEGSATPMVIIMPDASAGIRGYANGPAGKWRYEDFFFEEFMPQVENTFRIRGEKRYRAIAGLSMGGGGTYFYALHRPELFSSACPLSAVCGPLTREDTEEYLERRGHERGTDEQREEWYKQYSVLEQIRAIPGDQADLPHRERWNKSVRWYIDCGDDDFLYEGNSLVHIAMRKREIPHEFRIRDGGHTWTYWRESLPEVLSFVTDAFHQY